MKIRNGFVSNSSSSSFVVIGIKTEHSIDDIKLESGIEISSLYTEGSPYEYVSGYIVADEEYLDEHEINISEIIKEVATALKVEEKEIKLITGVRPS